jgi:hypothetical protein
MPTSKQCPFKEITIEGVRQSIKKGVVNLAGTPSGWSGTFRWNVGDTTPEEFEKRIMEQLLREPTGSLASSTPVPRDVAALAQTSGFATPGYLTPRNMSPPSDRPEVSRGNISGSKKKLSPQSAEVLPEQKRASSSRSVEPDELMAAMPFVTSSRLRDSAQCSAESAMSTDSAGGTDRQLRKLQKKLRQILELERLKAERPLTAKEQVKVESLIAVRLQIGLLASTVQTPDAGTPGSTLSGAPTMQAAASFATDMNAWQSALDALQPPPTQVGTRQSAIKVGCSVALKLTSPLQSAHSRSCVAACMS